MKKDTSADKKKGCERPTILVAVDFSHCSHLALRKALELRGNGKGRIVAVHVIDSDFVHRCIHHRLGDEASIKKALFLQAKERLHTFVRQEQGNGARLETLVCEGVPFMEINNKANALHADMIVIGSCGNAGDMNAIFFGGTSEKILRFITRPVLCVPPANRTT